MDTSRNNVESFLLNVAALALIVAGCLPAPGADNAPYVLIPYAAAILGFAMCLAARHDITFRHLPPEGIPDAVRTDRLLTRSHVATVASFACAIGEVLHLVIRGTGSGFGLGTGTSQGSIPMGVAYVLLMLLAGASMGRFHYGIGRE